MSQSIVKGKAVRWARESTSFSVHELASKIGVSPERLESAEADEKPLTFKQILKIANTCGVPITTFFLDELPPSETMVDFRIGQEGHQGLSKSPELAKSVRRVRLQRDAFLDYLSDASTVANPAALMHKEAEIIAFLRSLAGASENDDIRRSKVDSSEALRLTKQHVEEKMPCLVFESNIGSARGCSIYEEPLSLIILGTGDSANARRFTLIHECAHLLLKQPGLCDPLIAGSQIEDLCNRIAGSALLPDEALLDAHTGEWDELKIDSVAKKFKVSHSAVTVRLRQLQQIDTKLAEKLLEHYARLWRMHRDAQREREGGPNQYLLISQRLSGRFTQAIADQHSQGRLSTTQTASLLGIRSSNLAISTVLQSATT